MQVSSTGGRLKCARCEGLNPEIARFCNRCGQPLEGTQAPVVSPGAAEPAAVTKVGQVTATAPRAEAPRAEAPQASPPQADASASALRGRKICPGCHRFNAATAGFCADCGVALPKDSAVPLFGGPAGFWIRALAVVIDAVVLLAISALAASRLGIRAVDYERYPLMEAVIRDLPTIALDTTIGCLYAMLLIGTWGGTLGKLMLGLRVVRHSDGAKVPYGLALGRSLAQWVSAVPLGLGYLWVGLSPAKRAWHDYLCDTRVVYKKAE